MAVFVVCVVGNMPATTLDEKAVQAFREKKTREITAVLDEYIRTAEKSGVLLLCSFISFVVGWMYNLVHL